MTKEKKTKCPICSKKIGLYGIECRCGLLFCPLHRYPDQHNCLFDFKKYEKNILKDSLQRCFIKKLEKI